MNVITVCTGMLAENTYILEGTNQEALVIDPGDDAEKIVSALRQAGLCCRSVLLTHAHIDHINAVAALQEQGAAVYLHADDAPLLKNSGNLSHICNITFHTFAPDVLLSGGEQLHLSGLTFRVLHTPGHTAGSVCYCFDDCIFTGDTLFYLSVGRTDFPTGNPADLRKSLQKLFALQKNYELYPGHDRPTSLDFERENNPYA